MIHENDRLGTHSCALPIPLKALEIQQERALNDRSRLEQALEKTQVSSEKVCTDQLDGSQREESLKCLTAQEHINV